MGRSEFDRQMRDHALFHKSMMSVFPDEDTNVVRALLLQANRSMGNNVVTPTLIPVLDELLYTCMSPVVMEMADCEETTDTYEQALDHTWDHIRAACAQLILNAYQLGRAVADHKIELKTTTTERLLSDSLQAISRAANAELN